MARTMIDHACERCGKVRKVSPDKLAKGLQRVCRQCQGKEAAEKRREAMLRRGGPKPVTYDICKECRTIYETAAIDDDGYCCDTCRSKAAGHTSSYHQALAFFLYGKKPKVWRSWEAKQVSLF
ncbi:hypothetical protein [Marinobacterium stanieri]|uniref:hypothetical protein n=1 Tax=Marinobacterium stanieri TaxID=49186 RepID=UPI000255781C|nr:hypothetical protein [Marinobacterium stanieri]